MLLCIAVHLLAAAGKGGSDSPPVSGDAPPPLGGDTLPDKGPLAAPGKGFTDDAALGEGVWR